MNQARKAEIRTELVLADPPAALLFAGQWHEAPISSDQRLMDAWRRDFAALFATVPDSALLTIVDVHQ